MANYFYPDPTRLNDLDLTGSLDLITNIAAGQFAFQTFSLTTLNQPYTNYPVTTYGSLEVNSLHGGFAITGLSDNGSTGLTFIGTVGSITATEPAIQYISSKADGAGGLQALSVSEKVFSFNNFGSNIFDVYGTGAVMINAATFTTTSKLGVKAPALTTGTGTISNNNGADAGVVVGTGTSFTTELAVGDQIGISGGSGTQSTVRTITDNTHLTVDYYGLWPAGTAFQISKPTTRFLDSGNQFKAGVFPFGGVTAANYHALNAGSLIAIGEGGVTAPGIGFGFLDTNFNHTFRSAGGANLDIIFDVSGTSAHFFGINGLFKTGYGAVIGDSTFAASAPSNGLYVNGQVAIGSASPNASAKLDIISTTQGLGLPTMTTAQKNAIGSPRAGLLVFDSTLGTLSTYNGAIWV